MVEWIKEHKVYLLLGLAAAFAAGYYLYPGPPIQTATVENGQEWGLDDQKVKKTKETEAEAETEKEIVMADIKGAVAKPGVYVLTPGERVINLIEKAGGLTDKADSKLVNFAMRIEDEMALYIPEKGEELDPTVFAANSPDTNGSKKVNLNKAEQGELETLPGIGPAKALAIIEYRNANGGFKAVDDLKAISGIGQKTFEKLQELVAVQ